MWMLKIAALLHDPPTKALIITQRGERHEEVAEKLVHRLGIAELKVEEAGIGWLIYCHHPRREDERKEECQKALSREVGPLLALIEADHNSSAADRLIKEGVGELTFIHPLSGERLALRVDGRAEEVLEGVAEYLAKRLTEEVRKDPKRLYLAVWRFLPDALKHGLARAGGGYANINLPADTRVPTHTLWDHLKTTSALAPCIQGGRVEACFLRFELGGVQEFLSGARTTADYWAGSWLASILTFSIISALADRLGPDSIIYPEVHGTPLMDLWLRGRGLKEVDRPTTGELLTPVIPEAVLALVPTQLLGSLREAGARALDEAWRALARTVKDMVEKKVEEIPNRQQFEDNWERQTQKPPLPLRITDLKLPSDEAEAEEWWQRVERLEGEGVETLSSEVKEFLERLWGYLADPNHPRHPAALYSGLYEELQAHIHASGLVVRGYGRPIEPGGVAKRCNLCGVRNPVYEPKAGEFWDPLEQDYLVDVNERLCAVCLTKRLAGRRPKEVLGRLLQQLCEEEPQLDERELGYPSTSDIATAGFKLSLLELWGQLGKELEPLLKEFKEAWLNFIGVLKRLEVPTGPWEPVKVPLLRRRLQELKRRGVSSELLEWLMGLTGEYLFYETYDREVNRAREWLRAHRALKEDELGKLRSKAIEAREKLRSFLVRYRELAAGLEGKPEGLERMVLTPNDSLVILAADGDSMGKLISGAANPTVGESIARGVSVSKELRDTQRGQSPAGHAFISRTLNAYSLRLVRRLVEEEYCGRLVYAGGDDIRALLPPEDAYEIALRLREEYSREWGVFDEAGVRVAVMGMGRRATSSMALIGIHYMYHLGDAIDNSWIQLKRAKKLSAGWEKDAVYVSLHSRAGLIAEAGPVHNLYPDPKARPEMITGGEWQGVSAFRGENRLLAELAPQRAGAQPPRRGHRSPLLDALELAQLVRGRNRCYAVSRRLLYALLEVAPTLADRGLPQEAVRAELNRVINRHSRVREGCPVNKEALVDMLTYWWNEGCLQEVAYLAKIADNLLGEVAYD
jgi:CRISPR-associated protein Cmr2